MFFKRKKLSGIVSFREQNQSRKSPRRPPVSLHKRMDRRQDIMRDRRPHHRVDFPTLFAIEPKEEIVQKKRHLHSWRRPEPDFPGQSVAQHHPDPSYSAHLLLGNYLIYRQFVYLKQHLRRILDIGY